MWFVDHNLPTTNATWPIKGSKDADFRLVFFKKVTKNCLLGLGPRARWRHPKNPKATAIMTSPTKKLKSKTFQFSKYKLQGFPHLKVWTAL